MCKSNCCSNASNFGLFVLRAFVGGTFIFHGVYKVLHMSEPQGTIAFFSQIGFNAFWAYLVTIVEIGAGAALVLGIFSLYSALLLAVVMLVAAFKVKWGMPNTPFLMKYLSSELDLSILASLIAIGTVGPGSWSLWKMCGCKCHGTEKSCGMCKSVGCKDDCCQPETPSETPTV